MEVSLEPVHQMISFSFCDQKKRKEKKRKRKRKQSKNMDIKHAGFGILYIFNLIRTEPALAEYKESVAKLRLRLSYSCWLKTKLKVGP